MKLCALIIDDQPDSLKMIKTILELQHFHCVVAQNTEEASKKMVEFLPHLLVVDISLGPEENGLKWLEEVRKGIFQGLPAVILTSSAMLEDVQKSIELGVQDYVIKPPNPNVLKKKIQNLVEQLQTNKPYVFLNENEPAEGKVRIEGKISGISETGLCLATHLANRVSISFENVESELFGEIGIAPPKKLTFLNYEKENNKQDRFPVRNYCQAKGWVESDFVQIRLWIRRSKLVRDF